MCQGYESEYIWKIRLTPGLLDFLKARWELSPMQPPGEGIFCGQSMISGDKTPSWWSPVEGHNTHYYIGRLAKDMEFGDHFRVAVDKDRQLVFIHYWEKW